jgi:hypothetical protein
MQQVKEPKQQKPRKAAYHREKTSYTPSIPFHIAKVSYFIYNNTVYRVAHCTPDVFKSAVLKLAPHWISHDEYGPVLDDSDVSSRWYLLCALSECGRGMILYRTLEDAEEVMWQLNKLS